MSLEVPEKVNGSDADGDARNQGLYPPSVKGFFITSVQCQQQDDHANRTCGNQQREPQEGISEEHPEKEQCADHSELPFRTLVDSMPVNSAMNSAMQPRLKTPPTRQNINTRMMTQPELSVFVSMPIDP
jgi:hypothetical protein